jgi:chromosome partitioning protein
VARVVAVANQKGGVAKTTTVQNLGAALAGLGARVLLVDLDAQACLTYALGFDPDGLSPTLHDVLLGRTKAQDARVTTGGVDLLPASIDLAGSELHLLGRTGREQALARAIEPLLADYDVVLVDCAPSLGVLTVNALTAADEVLVPLQCEALSHRGVAQLLDTVEDVREFTNPRLVVRGAIATMYDGRTRHSREVLDDVRARFRLDVLEPPVPKSIRFAEAPGRGQSILEHAPGSAGAEAYRSLAATLWAAWRGTPPSGSPGSVPAPHSDDGDLAVALHRLPDRERRVP